MRPVGGIGNVEAVWIVNCHQIRYQIRLSAGLSYVLSVVFLAPMIGSEVISDEF